MQTNFADTILNIAVTGPLIRIDFGTLVPDPADPEKKKLIATTTQQLVMPIEGFARAFSTQQRIIKMLVDSGILEKPAKSE